MRKKNQIKELIQSEEKKHWKEECNNVKNRRKRKRKLRIETSKIISVLGSKRKTNEESRNIRAARCLLYFKSVHRT